MQQPGQGIAGVAGDPMGVGSNSIPYTIPVENINGQAITLAMKHQDKRDQRAVYAGAGFILILSALVGSFQ
jgi:hypothetical protein